jgi:type IV pilus assembly protein PilZ
MSENSNSSRNGILSLTIKDKAVLYSAYMPYLHNGGLFVPTNKAYNVGEKIPIAGKVVWVTPRGAQGNRTAGIGVQFSEQDAAANSKIENHLAGSLSSDRPTHTM